MTDPIVYWKRARGYELEPAPLTEESLEERNIDDFVVEATLVRMERHPSWQAEAARLREGVQAFGLAKYPNLHQFWCHLWAQFSSLNDSASADTALWFWGPPARADRALYAAVAEMGRGPIRRALSRVGWTNAQLKVLFDQWLKAAHVHKAAEHRAWQVFDEPHAPVVVGRSHVKPPTPEMGLLALELADNDTETAKDLLLVLPWIAARAQGTDFVSVPTEALTQGKSRHPDAPGIPAKRGRTAWRLVQPLFIRKTRGHKAGSFPAEYQIHPRYFAALGVG